MTPRGTYGEESITLIEVFMLRRRLAGSVAWGAFVTAACSQSPVSVSSPSLSADAVKVDAPAVVPVYGISRPKLPGDPCRRGKYLGFNFWVGTWNVYGPDGQQAGTNRVSNEVRGCTVEEHWTDQGGGRGRSLNTYDAGTDRWSQLWMDASGLALYFDGTAGPDQMMLGGDQARQFGGPLFGNRLTWTRLGEDRVRQFWEISDDGDVTWTTAFDGEYRRVKVFTPAAEAPNTFCLSPSRPRYLWFDFLIGEWQVRPSPDGKSLGNLSVQKDVSGCLVESVFRGTGNYQGKAFAANHFPTRLWHRTWIDSDGIRVALTGQLVGTSMVMTGPRVAPGGQAQDLRLTWTPVDPNRVDETWEVSLDGGATWIVDHAFVLIRRR